MTEEIYLGEPGYGSGRVDKAPYCTLGKICQAAGHISKNGSGYQFVADLGLNDVEIYSINDKTDYIDGIYYNNKFNHYKAVKLALQQLQELGHEVILPEPYFAEVEDLCLST